MAMVIIGWPRTPWTRTWEYLGALRVGDFALADLLVDMAVAECFARKWSN